MNTTPHWTAYVTAIILPIIALIAAWIAFRQSQIAKNKLKLDLFDKRMAVYETVRKTLGAATSHGKLTPEDEIDYLVGTRSAQWLFDTEVSKYVDETLWHKIVELELHNSMSDSLLGDERKRYIHARCETIKWLVAQYKEFDKLCAEYMALKH